MRTTIIIPTYNEARNIALLTEAILKLGITDLSILIVDDNSPDGTGLIADRLSEEYPDKVKVMHRTGKDGLRSAYMAGFTAALDAGADVIGQMDADFSHQPEKIPQMLAELEEMDFVLGSRYVPGGSLDEKWPFWRKALSFFGNTYSRIILGVSDIRDMTTGYRLWRAETLRGMPLNRVGASGYIFLVEMAYLAHILEYRCGQVPIHFSERIEGESKMSLKIQLEAAYRVWQVKTNYTDLRKLGKNGRQPI